MTYFHYRTCNIFFKLKENHYKMLYILSFPYTKQDKSGVAKDKNPFLKIMFMDTSTFLRKIIYTVKFISDCHVMVRLRNIGIYWK